MSAIHDLIHGTRVRDLGPLPAPRLALNATVYQAVQMLVRGNRGAVVVLEGKRPVGIFTERDVLYRLPEGLFTAQQQRRHTPLRDVMSQPLATIDRQAKLAEAIGTMVEKQYRHLVIVDHEGELRGLLTTADLVQFVVDQFPQDTLNLPPRLRQQYHSPEGA